MDEFVHEFDAMEELRVSREQLDRMMRDGSLVPHHYSQSGAVRYYLRRDLDNYFARLCSFLGERPAFLGKE